MQYDFCYPAKIISCIGFSITLFKRVLRQISRVPCESVKIEGNGYYPCSDYLRLKAFMREPEFLQIITGLEYYFAQEQRKYI